MEILPIHFIFIALFSMTILIGLLILIFRRDKWDDW